MKALFVELPAFARYRADYLNDEEFRHLQDLLLHDPKMGDVIEGTGVLESSGLEIRSEEKGSEVASDSYTFGGSKVGRFGCSLCIPRARYLT